jgi:hypothetical protein
VPLNNDKQPSQRTKRPPLRLATMIHPRYAILMKEDPKKYPPPVFQSPPASSIPKPSAPAPRPPPPILTLKERVESKDGMTEATVRGFTVQMAVFLRGMQARHIAPLPIDITEMRLHTINGLPFPLIKFNMDKMGTAQLPTLDYRAPEWETVAFNTPEAERMDIYTMGVLMYYMMTGTFPKTGHSEDFPLVIPEGAVAISESGLAILRYLLHINPMERPTAEELLQDTTWMMVDLPQRSPPPPSMFVRQMMGR